jgi:hypothetical protein
MTRGRRRDLTEILNFISSAPCGVTKKQVAEFLGVRPDTTLDYMQTLKRKRLICTVGHSYQLKWASAVNFEATVLEWSRSKSKPKPRARVRKTAAVEPRPQHLDEMIHRSVPANTAPRLNFVGRNSVFDV